MPKSIAYPMVRQANSIHLTSCILCPLCNHPCLRHHMHNDAGQACLPVAHSGRACCYSSMQHNQTCKKILRVKTAMPGCTVAHRVSANCCCRQKINKNITLFGVNFMQSQVLYRAAQVLLSSQQHLPWLQISIHCTRARSDNIMCAMHLSSCQRLAMVTY